MNAILEILQEQSLSWSNTKYPCPPPATFFERTIGFQASRFDVRVFARHLLVCSRCAAYWQAIQDDSCLSLGELYGLFKARPGHGQDFDFARLRAEDHLAWCIQCQDRRNLVNGIRRMFSFSPSPWYVNLGKALAMENLEPVFCNQYPEETLVYRSHDPEEPLVYHKHAHDELDGWVLGCDGDPRLVLGRLLRLPVKLVHAIFRNSGVIEISMEVTPNVQKVLCAITVGGQALLLPECRPQENVATFSFDVSVQNDTAVQKKDRKDSQIPSSALTVWLSMSDLDN